MKFRTLESEPFERIHAAFLRGFEDYVIPLQLSAEQLGEMLTRRGWRPELSVGAYDDEEIVAFTLNGIGSWNGLPTAYDSGTGVAVSHRRKGLGRETMVRSLDLLRPHVSQYLLEVIQQNRGAFELYRSLGFETTRDLQCWSLTAVDGQGQEIAIGESARLEDPRAFWDIEPSWQNSLESVVRATATKTYLVAHDGNRMTGYAQVIADSSELVHLAVDPASRRRGVGRSLCVRALELTGRPLRILNLDPRAEHIAGFLSAIGATKTIVQHEMLRAI